MVGESVFRVGESDGGSVRGVKVGAFVGLVVVTVGDSEGAWVSPSRVGVPVGEDVFAVGLSVGGMLGEVVTKVGAVVSCLSPIVG